MHCNNMTCNSRPSRKKQQGVAIITALLIVTIATTVSITISTRLQLDVRRTGNMIAQDQADFYLYAAEKWSQRILKQDLEDSKTDDLTEAWAMQLPPIPVEGGTIQGKLTDLHGCLNISSLLTAGKINATTQERLNNLFNLLGIQSSTIQALVDWMDTDLQTTTPGGAEDGYYLNLEQPYRVANTTMVSISETRLVRGFEDPKVFAAVAPYICAYDTGNNDASINVNTASAEVLKSLSPDMTDEIVRDIIQHREGSPEDPSDGSPFENINEFYAFNQISDIIKDKSGLSVSSNYFLLRTQARIGQANKIMYSIIYRDDKGGSTVIMRTQRTL
jgi:general secretion pathway protein K